MSYTRNKRKKILRRTREQILRSKLFFYQKKFEAAIKFFSSASLLQRIKKIFFKKKVLINLLELK